jgi:hypothetical protein
MLSGSNDEHSPLVFACVKRYDVKGKSASGQHNWQGFRRKNWKNQFVWRAVISADPRGSHPVSLRANEIKAPFWSWTAICHQAYLLRQWYREGGTCHELVEVERVHVDPSGNSFAEVKGDTLTLRCRYSGSGRAIPKGDLDGFAVAISSQGILYSNAYPDRKIGNFEGEVLTFP